MFCFGRRSGGRYTTVTAFASRAVNSRSGESHAAVNQTVSRSHPILTLVRWSRRCGGWSSAGDARPHRHPWAMRPDVTGFHVQVDGVKPDGRRYLLATDEVHSIQPLSRSKRSPDTQRSRAVLHLERVAKTTLSSTTQGLVRDSLHHFSVPNTYVLQMMRARPSSTPHLPACTGKDDVYADVHLSQTRSSGDETASLQPLLHRLTIVGAPTPSSLDHFRAGSAPTCWDDSPWPSRTMNRRCCFEQANPTLDRPLWQLLVHHLGTAYGRTGKLRAGESDLRLRPSKERRI